MMKARKNGNINFSDAYGQLTLWYVIRSGRIPNSSKLLCMSSLPVSMKRIPLRTSEKRWQHRFSNNNTICCHGNQWSDLAKFRIHPNSGSCMLSLPASMKRIRSRTAEKKWRHRFFPHHNPICYHGNQWLDLAEFQTHPSSHVCYHYLHL